MQNVSLGDNLHEIWKPISGRNKKNIILSFADFAQRKLNTFWIQSTLVISNSKGPEYLVWDSSSWKQKDLKHNVITSI